MRQFESRGFCREPLRSPDPDRSHRTAIVHTRPPTQELNHFMRTQLERVQTASPKRAQPSQQSLHGSYQSEWRSGDVSYLSASSTGEGILRQFQMRMGRLGEQNRRLIAQNHHLYDETKRKGQQIEIVERKCEYLKRDNELLKSQIIYLNEHINKIGKDKNECNCKGNSTFLQTLEGSVGNFLTIFEKKITETLSQMSVVAKRVEATQYKIKTVLQDKKQKIKEPSECKQAKRSLCGLTKSGFSQTESLSSESFRSRAQLERLRIENEKLLVRVKKLEEEVCQLGQRCVGAQIEGQKSRCFQSLEGLFGSRMDTGSINLQKQLSTMMKVVEQERAKAAYYQKMVYSLKQKVSQLKGLGSRDDSLRHSLSSANESISSLREDSRIEEFLVIVAQIREDLEAANIENVLEDADFQQTQINALRNQLIYLKEAVNEKDELLNKIKQQLKAKQEMILQLRLSSGFNMPANAKNSSKLDNRTKVRQKLKKTFGQIQNLECKVRLDLYRCRSSCEND